MKRIAHTRERHGLLTTARHAAMALLLGTAVLPAQAQEQWCNDIHSFNIQTVNGLGVYGSNGGALGCGYTYQCVAANSGWGQNYGGLPSYFNVPAGVGLQEFFVRIRVDASLPVQNGQPWIVQVDGAACASCSAEVVETFESTPYTGQGGYTFYYNDAKDPDPHTADNNWPNGTREFGLSMSYFGQIFQNTQVRFKAVMIGNSFSDLMGYYNAPALPYFILRDPPGGQSYASMSQGSTTCSGFSQSTTTGSTENDYFKAKVGFAGSIGWIVDIPFEIFAEFGVDVTAEQSETSELEYETCFEASSEFTTSADGTPDDMFIGSAIRYAYGMMQIITRPDCNLITPDAKFASEAVSLLSSYHFTESHIRSTLIPQLTAEIATLTPGTSVYDSKVDQLSVWNQALALNDSIKAAAPFAITRSFSGGGAGQTFSQTTTTSLKTSIDYSVALEEGLSFDFGAYIGGNGVGFGNSMKMRTEYGSSSGASNQNTNSMAYHLEDGDVYDSHTVNVHEDKVFGSYVFFLDSANSRTSCKYEGGYPLDQPSLSVGTPGNTTMAANEVTVGSAANFPLVVCNNSDTTRTYYLKFDAATNAQGAVMQAFGNTLNSNDDGIQLELLGGQCINTNLTLTQPNVSVLDFDNINLRLYSLCEEEYPPYVRSYITISAHFGAGNFGDYCVPVSTTGTAQGDYVDGVQLASIDNTGTGSVSGASYTDYSGSFSTPLSRNAQKVITLTSGDNLGDHYAAWIDYDHSGSFDVDEMLGEFTNTAAGSVQSIAFTVPANAALGSTLLRVRGVNIGGGEPTDLDPCFNYAAGETEDYSVVINANTPQDCAGVNNGPALPGTACDDGNANTGLDTWSANCVCAGVPSDCAGVPGGTALPGTACDDGLPGTGADTYNANCQCVGLAYDCLGVPGGAAIFGSPCDDGNAATGNDVYNAGCQCVGQVIDCVGVPGGTTLPGAACNDGNAATTGDVYNVICICAGTLTNDCEGTLGGPAQPGTACDDDDTTTGNDVYGTDCVCAGQVFDCAGVPGGTAIPGTPCDDGNTLTNEDAYDGNCTCLGILANDCAGVPGGTAQPGTACDDGNGDTGNDAYDAFCNCSGQLFDCIGDAGGTALPGTPCDDGNAGTENDAYTLGCDCEGVVPTGVAEADPTAPFSVQPNPSTGVFTLNNPAGVATRVEVRDAVGRLVMQPLMVGTSRASTVDLSGMAPGTYHLVVGSEGRRQVIKIIVHL